MNMSAMLKRNKLARGHNMKMSYILYLPYLPWFLLRDPQGQNERGKRIKILRDIERHWFHASYNSLPDGFRSVVDAWCSLRRWQRGGSRCRWRRWTRSGRNFQLSFQISFLVMLSPPNPSFIVVPARFGLLFRVLWGRIWICRCLLKKCKTKLRKIHH